MQPCRADGDAKQVTKTQVTEEKIDGKIKKSGEPPRVVPFKDLRNLVEGSTDEKSVLIKGLLEGGRIHHQENRPLDATGGAIEFDSGDLEPDQPLISSVPETKEKVKIRVCYKISRTPISGANCGN